MTFSIVIATYQPGNSLSRTLQSIFDQTYQNFEVVIQDNLSSDSATQEVIQQYLHRISFKSQKDNGIYHAFNLALSRCQGDWIIFLGADDYFASEHVLQNIHDNIDEKANMILGEIHNFNMKSRWIPSKFQSKMSRKILWKNTIHQQGCFYKRSWIQPIGFSQDLKILGDYELHLKAFLARTPFLPTHILIAHCQAEGASKQFTSALYNEELKIKKRLLPWYYYWINILWIFGKKSLKT